MGFPPFSLQFDPAPRRGEPLVQKRIPDYFRMWCKVSSNFYNFWMVLISSVMDKHCVIVLIIMFGTCS